jgi:hypothetical protein
MTQQGTPGTVRVGPGDPRSCGISGTIDGVGPDEVVEALSAVAARAGVEVRIEPFELAIVGKGGLCRIEGQLVILVDAKLGSLERAGVIGEALAEVDLEGIDVPAEVAAYLGTGHGQVKPLVRPRPLRRGRLRRVK